MSPSPSFVRVIGRAICIALLSTLVLNSCTFHIGKDPEPSSGGGGTGGGTGPSINFVNITPFDVTVKLNNETKNVKKDGGFASFSGSAGASATYSAETMATSSTGGTLGVKATWTKTISFPASGSETENLEVSKDFFFLKIFNSSGNTISKVTVGSNSDNVQIVSSTSQTLPTDVAYYRATSSPTLKVDFTNGSSKTFTSLDLPGEVNQVTIATLTPGGGGSVFSFGGGLGGGSGSGSGSGSGTGPTITLGNKGFTEITATLNSVTKTIPAGGTAVFQGSASASASYTAETSGKTTSGTQVGLKLTWTNTTTFPASGNKTIDLVVSKDYFFISFTNNSSKTINKLIVNKGLTSETTDNIVIATGGTKFAIGYYRAFSNTIVRAEESGGSFWEWSPAQLNLPFTENQSVSLVANN